MTEISDLSTPEQVRRYLMSSVKIRQSPILADATSWFLDSDGGEQRGGFEFFEFVDGVNGEIGLIAVDSVTAQRFEIRIKEEE